MITDRQAMAEPAWDLLVVGGGINGAGIARDAVGRGLSVLMVEAEDLAQHTSSASTKLIHGGLRYLEYGEFRLVREALIERETLWGMAPHIIWPLRFVLPQMNSPRPAWMVRLGLFLYDHIGGRKRLPATETVNLARSPLGAGLKPGAGKAFIYSDCWVEDSRLVVLNAMDAASRGATVLTRTRLVSARRRGALWEAVLADSTGERTVSARAIVNAAGPWVEDVLQRTQDPAQGGAAQGGQARKRGVRLVKGSHIVVPRLYHGDHAFLLQNPDRRVVFAIPYEREFTLVGTTDEAWQGPPAKATISEAETAYLIETVNRYFSADVGTDDVCWSYAGIRPLYDDHASSASAVTRDYVLDLDTDGGAPLLSVFGGKITTFRKLAEHAMEKLSAHFPMAGPAWTAGAVLPGGDLPGGDFDAFVAELASERPAFPHYLIRRLARAYGSRAEQILEGARVPGDLGRDFGGGLTEAELVYLYRNEWARTAEDVLWRRSKLGLHTLPQAAPLIDAFLAGLHHG
ncbi:FAD dependent oxidoreductase [Novosphingobium nitrogenifigens DSM 19370]|uniref:Glycerol-3-phosphate dehydrogenase n=1 Tax=Novosphingobium nitrogenifigens DSM 19370 TaxID=983920 RepID=F1ZAG6_9SPHN|nr:glycerol-3-phosphate dehydrogenase [Novosphingobium nitrogenifigens]EGD58426.1 FAD dependent oxidoreductase [Novosphingobium nitrogenifigens DSM 19370]